MIKAMKDEPTLFMDGENHQLQQIFQLLVHDLFRGSVLKSGGSCSPTQQLLDYIKAFMTLHNFFNGVTLQRALETPDDLKIPNCLTREFGPALAVIDSASRRVFLTYFHELEDLVERTYDHKTIQKGWIAIGATDFDQERQLARCPGWNDQFTADEKLEIHACMPKIVRDCAPLGYATDESIYEHLGHLIGPPSRGLPGATPLVGPVVAEAVVLPPIDHQAPQTTTQTRLLIPRLTPPDAHVGVAKMSLQQMAFSRWRASFWTKDNILMAISMQGDAQRAIENIKTARMEANLLKKHVAANKKEAKRQDREDTVTFGPRQRVNRPKNEVLCCEFCLKDMPTEPPEAADDWQQCDTCEGRWYCPEDTCLQSLAEHETRCKIKRQQVEQDFQAAKIAAPRIIATETIPAPKRKTPGGGGGRGKGPKG